MKRVKYSFIALSAVVLSALSFNANASLLVEPHVGYIVSGNADYQSSKISYNGPEYGARLGAQVLGFMAGLDYSHSTFTEKSKSGGLSGDDDQKRDQVGLFAGYNLPILLRAWVTYYFMDKKTQTANGKFGLNGDYQKGSGFGIGVGFTPLPLISVNLEYHSASYDKTNNGALNPQAEPKEVILGVSLPLTLL